VVYTQHILKLHVYINFEFYFLYNIDHLKNVIISNIFGLILVQKLWQIFLNKFTISKSFGVCILITIGVNLSCVEMKSWAGKALETVNRFTFLKCKLTVVIRAC
jgi:hypothetical protein